MPFEMTPRHDRKVPYSMIRHPKIARIQHETLPAVMGNGGEPVFVACIRQDSHFKACLGHLGTIAATFSEQGMAVCYVLEDLLPYFAERFNVCGTPTFLLIVNGTVLGRLLGQSPCPAMIGFIRNTLARLRAGGVQPGK